MNNEITNSEMSKTYNPSEVEAKWYTIWEDGGYFKPKNRGKNDTYTILMPLPNVTGKLHVGHALDATTQDALVRFKRMQGYEALWIPGTDHAGISTQAVVEKMVYEKEGKKRQDFTKDEFLKKIWAWKEEFGDTISQQQKKLGASCDWDYAMFTLDDEAHETVNKVFIDLYNEGLIYKSDYIINWDTELQSAISDAEVEHVEIKGAFYHINYKVEGSEQLLEIATTRPETLLGDSAIAVNPDDERFKDLIGKRAIIPICNRSIPIVGDSYVDIEKGTGCLKVTPGHDFNDFEIGRRHNLEIINIINKDGTLNDNGMMLKGMSCLDARKKIITLLEEQGLLVKVEEHVHQVGHGERSKSIIEPLVSKQWFLNVKEMAKVAVDHVENGNTTFYPKTWENTYFAWLKEPKNWCISRQLWWGHQIPVFYCNDCNHQWAMAETITKCEKCNSTNINQDPDVLDTWFSSGLWPLTTLGWPNKERMKQKGFDKFYPNSTLVTGFDIIFFWVARMMMMSLKSVKSIPFKKVYIHAIVRDTQGRKMSKSLGNGIDPNDMIAQYGADALRFTLTAGSGYNRNLNLDPERIGGYRNFINKIWNAFRFIHPFLKDANESLPKKLTHQEKWILSELNLVTKQVNESMEEFRFDDSCKEIYQFIYDKFCSWFIELSKNTLYGDDDDLRKNRASVLRFTFRNVVALMHPMSPFITEELWGYLKNINEDLLIIQSYPQYNLNLNFPEEQMMMNDFIDIMTHIRNLRAKVNIKPKEEINVHLFTNDKQLNTYLTDNIDNFLTIAKSNVVINKKSSSRPAKSLVSATHNCEIFIPLEGIIDIDAQVNRLNKDLSKVKIEYDKLAKKLGNKKFIDKAPDNVISEVKGKHFKLYEKMKSIRNSLDIFS